MRKETLVGPDWTTSRQKRIIDCIGIAAASPALLAVGPATAAGLAVMDRQNPFLTQQRPGLGMTPFDIYKFRTMPIGTPETPSEGPNDARATPFGKVVRRAHFDEIPQALNILKGDLSLVGPRPLTRPTVEQTLELLSPYEQQEWLAARSTARPGLTSHYQLELHHTDYADINKRDRALSDIEYANTATRAGDTRIMLESGITSIHSLLLSNRNDEQREARPGYRKGAKLLQHVASDFGVTLGEKDITYWRVVFGAARALDDIVDRENVVDIAPYLERLRGGRPINGMTENEALDFKNTIINSSDARQETLFDTFNKLPSFAARRNETSTVHELVKVNREEAEYFATILELDLDDSCDIEQRLKFNGWLHNFATIGYLADTVTDLKADYEAGTTNVLPTRNNQLLLALYCLPEALGTLGKTPPVSIWRLGSIAVHNIKQRND